VGLEEIDLARAEHRQEDLRKATASASGADGSLSERMDMDIENVRKIKNGKKDWIGFDIADKIVTVCTDGLGWRNDPELFAIYQSFDFGWLDAKKPCAVAA
jgi:DNA-binding Xre family transcriptional regulator